MYDLMIFL